MNTKDLFTNQAVVNNIAESLEDIPQDSSAKYDLWVVGYNIDNEPVSELFIYEFNTPEEALSKAETIDPKFVEEQTEMSFTEYILSNNLECVTIEVEACVEDVNDTSAGTIYTRDIWLNEDQDEPLENVANIVAVVPGDYSFLDDGTFKVRNDFLQEYKPGDVVKFYFVDEPDSDLLTYRIVSEVEYIDGKYFHCELVI